MSDGSICIWVGLSGTLFYRALPPTIKHAGISGTGWPDCPAAGVSNDAVLGCIKHRQAGGPPGVIGS